MNLWAVFGIALGVAAGIKFGFWSILMFPIWIGLFLLLISSPWWLWKGFILALELLIHVIDGILTLLGDLIDVYVLGRGESVQAVMAAREQQARDAESKAAQDRAAAYEELMWEHQVERGTQEEEIEY